MNYLKLVLKNFPKFIHKRIIKFSEIVPAQKERIQENYAKQLRKIASGNYTPIVVDCENKIINGHPDMIF